MAPGATTIDDLAAAILAAGGVTTQSSSQSQPQQQQEASHEDATMNDDDNNNNLSPSNLSRLESWLGLPEAAAAASTEDDFDDAGGMTTTMMEDVAPFDAPFYQALEELLVQSWQPDETATASSSSSTLMYHSNCLLDLTNVLPCEISLMDAMESVRITRLFRYWMDLNVLGSDRMMRTEEDEAEGSLFHTHTTVSQWLLLECHPNATITPGDTTSSTQKPHKGARLIAALYSHIESLPQLQSQIHLYSQSLMRGEGRAVLNNNANTQARLAQYQEAQQISARLNKEWEEHLERLEAIVGEWYTIGTPEIRRQCRMLLGSVWSKFVARAGTGGGVKMENTSSSGIPMTLRVLHRILLGSESSSIGSRVHEHLLIYHLIPLHRPNSMVLWRDQTSLLELYHEPLVQCIAFILQKQPSWIPKTMAGLLDPEVWPKGENTPKLVLLLHEIDTYIGILPEPIEKSSLGDSFHPLLQTLGLCLSSDHSRLAERALAFFKNSKFQTLIELNFEQSVTFLLPFLVRREPAWNPTVRKMTYTVLKKFQDFDEERFLRLCSKVFPEDDHPEVESTKNKSPSPATSQTGSIKLSGNQREDVKQHDFSLKSGMAGWKPPSAAYPRRDPSGQNRLMPPPMNRPPQKSGAPPLSVTGVAPWAMSNRTGPQAMRPPKSKNPPLTVTGVAPWAMSKPTPSASTNGKHSRTGESLGHLEEVMETQDSNGLNDNHPGENRLPRVLRYMEQIKPAADEEGESSWAKAQMAESPTLLPDMKFHDLVFGHVLGEGAFGVVKYARLIDKSRTRSQWPEYAVKIISTEKIKELGYEASVQRELAVMRVLSHPGISRLISSFRFREGVYLVLEYASGGDLHSVLQKHGSLDHDSTRFVIGETIAALSSIHDMGMVYADLKPENIILTESGHAKLCDFGGCRPVTTAAKERIQSSAKNLLKELRDGDWKPSSRKNQNKDTLHEYTFSEPEDIEMNDDVNSKSDYDLEDDIRVEGTTAYLPPEVVLGGVPNMTADCWALGCVLYQCLSGRPPIMEEDDSATRHRIVSFDAPTATDSRDALFEDSHASGISTDARDLIRSLLNRNPSERPSLGDTARHDFFVKSGTDVFTLYQKPALQLDVGDVSPVADAQWSRRQFSSIWAPQPQAYDIGITTDSSQAFSTSISSGAIEEGEECGAFFSKSASTKNYLNLRNISERAPLPPQG